MKRDHSITRAGLGALAVAGALAAALAAPAVASAEYLGYPDLHEGQWYVSSGLVDWSEERGVINGVDGAWLPDGPVDRAQAAAILFNYSGDAAPSEGATFDDASELGWAAAACAWAQDEGVFNGSRNADGTVTMDPWARLSREQAAAILHNMSGEAAGDPASLAAFPDGGEVSAWAQGAVAWAVEGGVMGNNGEINPADSCTRAEFVAMVKNAFEPEWAPGGGDEPGGGSGGEAGGQPGVDLTDPDVDPGDVIGGEWVWEPTYETVETPVYESKWVADVYEGPVVHDYCRWCGYDAGLYIPVRYTEELGGFWEMIVDTSVGSYWGEKYNDLLGHIQRNDCDCPADVKIDDSGDSEGIVGKYKGHGSQLIMNHRVELDTGHYEDVQVGTKTEVVETGGKWVRA